MGPCLASRGGFCSRSSLSSLDSFSISLALDEAWSPLSTGPEAFSCSGLVAKEVAGGLGYRLERALELEDDDSKTYIRSVRCYFALPVRLIDGVLSSSVGCLSRQKKK